MIKALLRHQFGLKLYCVEGVSSDDDDSPYSTLVEQMLAVFSSFYSMNLSSDTKRAKRGRALRGEFNGSYAPIGYNLITKARANDNRPAGLHIDCDVAPVVAEAFNRYASGTYSDILIAEWMNKQPAIQRLRSGAKPIGKEMIRDVLQNRIYLGQVSYAETLYDGSSLGQKKKARRNRVEWHPGKHKPIVEESVFERCQAIRSQLSGVRTKTPKTRTYFLPDRVYCAHCIARDHQNIGDRHYGKMRMTWHNRDKTGHYRCVTRDRGYGECCQKYVREEVVIEQIVKMISGFRVPDNALGRIDSAVKTRQGSAPALAQLAELEQEKQRVQFSWEHGHLLPEEYLQRTNQLEREIASMRPLDYDRLEEAVDLITHFQTYWDQCAKVDDPREARRQLMSKIIDRVFLYNDSVIAIALHPDFGIVLDMPDAAPDQILEAVKGKEKGYNSSELYPVRGRRGSNPRSRP